MLGRTSVFAGNVYLCGFATRTRSPKEMCVLQTTRIRACLVAVFLVQPFLLARSSAGQAPIRVQSDEVLVPTVVFDKELYAQLNKQEPHHRNSYGRLVAKDTKLWNDIVVKNLTAKDFHLFEDNQEQKIQSVKWEPPAFRVVQDNLGKHPELVGSGGGLWASADLPKSALSIWLAWPHYVLAYVPPKSAVGSCHQIQVTVERAKVTVWTRSEYCNTTHPASDPLSGTEFGNRLEKAATSNISNGIDVKLKVAAFADGANGARIYVTASFPRESLRHEFRDGTLYATIGSLVMVYRKNGTLVARYSDFACCDYGDEKKAKGTQNATETPVGGEPSVSTSEKLSASSTTEGRAILPDRYETQFSLPPGEYVIHVVISDGVHFGAQSAALVVGNYDPGKLSVSGLVLCHRTRKVSQNLTEGEVRLADSYAPLVSKGVEFTPATNTDFFRDDTLFAYFEIADPLVVAGQPGARVLANLKIVDLKTGSLVDTFEPVDTSTYTKAGSPVIAVGRGVMLEHLSPGTYRLEVQATAEGQSSEWRSAEFTLIEVPPLELNDAASPKGKKDEVIVNVTALDSDNRPATDLTTADFQIFEDERRQEITLFKATSGRTAGAPPPIVILFDLLNTIPRQREYIASRIIKVLQPLERDEGIYLYLLTNEGALYPVLPKGNMQAAAIAQGSVGEEPGANAAEGSPWTKEIRPLLNQAIDEVHGFRLMDFKDVGMRAVTTFNRLGQIEGQMAYVRGPKTILWITSGVPNSIPHTYGGCQDQTFYGVSESYLAGRCGWECHPSLSDTKCLDYMPFFQHFGAEAVASNTTVSSVTDLDLQNSVRGTPANTLQQLAELTGGRVYVSLNSEVEPAIRDALQGVLGRYTMAYTAPVSDGKRHRLRVECTREGIHLMAPQERFAVSSADHSDSKP